MFKSLTKPSCINCKPARWLFLRQVAAVLLFHTALFSSVSYAAEVDGLLEALVPVQDQSERSRLRGLQNGLAQVLIKQTGSSQTVKNPGIRQALSLAPRYVTEYGYTTIADTSEEGQNTLALSASFSEGAVRRLLFREQLPVWPANRMNMLFWLVRDDPEFGRQHVTMDVMPEAYRAMDAALQRRGVPVIKPVLDLQDRLTLNPQKAWDFDEESYQSAAKRYNADLWLALRIYQAGDGSWRGSVWASIEGEKIFENVEADDITQLVDQAVNRVVDSYSPFYTYVPELQTGDLLLTISNIRNYIAFREVNAYLRGLELVQTLKLDSISNDQLTLRLTLNGDPSLLFETLSRDKQFETLPEVSGQDVASHEPSIQNGFSSTPSVEGFHFRWVKQ